MKLLQPVWSEGWGTSTPTIAPSPRRVAGGRWSAGEPLTFRLSSMARPGEERVRFQVELLDADGNVLGSGPALLSKDDTEWWGRVEANLFVHAGRELVLRLPDGRQGRCEVIQSRAHARGADLRGVGEPPF